jgi:hypothetical protein
MKINRVAGVCGLGVAAILLMAGCSDRISAWDVRMNPSPELQTMNDTSGQQWNKVFRTADTNWRGAQEDFYRVMMLDSPDPMGRIPIP